MRQLARAGEQRAKEELSVLESAKKLEELVLRERRGATQPKRF